MTLPLETRGVENYPFPAVTFYPGEFSTKKSFLRTLMNHFELTRYTKSSPLYDNQDFLDKYSTFVAALGPGTTSLFAWVPDYLLYTEKKFIKQKEKDFRNEICSLLVLKNKTKTGYKTIKDGIIDKFNDNMFKYYGYSDAKDFSKKAISYLLNDVVVYENITDTETNAACNDKEMEGEKKEIAALVLSFLYIFIDFSSVVSLGPGDLAAQDHFLVRDVLHTELTNMFNDLSGANLPSSVLQFPEWFVMPGQRILNIIEQSSVLSSALPASISKLEVQRYQEFWKEYNNYKTKITYLCSKESCAEEDYHLVQTKGTEDQVESLLKDETKKNRVRQAEIFSAPCQDVSLVKQFKFESVCDFLKNISSYKTALLTLLKFSKQSPVFQVSEKEENETFGNLASVSSQYGYFPQKVQTRPNSFISMCQFQRTPNVMRLENCDLFRRSFTNKGLGFTFNNAKSEDLYKHSRNLDLQMKTFFFNNQDDPRMINSASPDESLNIIVENNFEEIFAYENTKNADNPEGEIKYKPKSVDVVLHDPRHPANIRTKRIKGRNNRKKFFQKSYKYFLYY